METVVEENPLSFATSRMVTITDLYRRTVVRRKHTSADSETSGLNHHDPSILTRLNSGRGWRTLQQRVERVSSRALISKFCAMFFAAAMGIALSPQGSYAVAQAKAPANSSPNAGTSDPARLFADGQSALNEGNLNEAEHDFQQVLAINPQMGGAYANLGVVYMR